MLGWSIPMADAGISNHVRSVRAALWHPISGAPSQGSPESLHQKAVGGTTGGGIPLPHYHHRYDQSVLREKTETHVHLPS